jgi:hypothetical protein
MDFLLNRRACAAAAGRLVVLFVLAVVAIVAVIDVVVWIAMGHRPVKANRPRSNVSLLLTSTIVVLAASR